MFDKIKKALWGELSSEDQKRFALLSLTFLFIIGTYWLMRPLKDGIFFKVVGGEWQPLAKILSVCVLVPLVFFYSKLVDLVEKQKLFYIICSFFSIFFIGVSFALQHPSIGLANTVTSPDRLLGWFVYLGIESFGTLMVALFWSFVISSSETDSAKKGYPLIIAGAQIGSLLGPTIATQAESLGMSTLTFIVAGGIAIVPFLVKYFITVFPSAAEKKSEKSTKSTGMIEGLKLLLSRKYLLGILGVATLYEVIGTILDYQMKMIANQEYADAAGVTKFLGFFGQATNGLALVFALVGTSFLIRRYGLTFCLVAFPVAVGLVVGNVLIFPSLWVLFIAMVAIKGLSYALNNPCKEIMYIPTSKDAKFKAKGWIDMFGGRTAKATGSGINFMFTSLSALLFYGSILSLGIVVVWGFIALYLGRENKKLVEAGTIVS